MSKSKLVLHLLGWVTILGFGGLGIFLALVFQDRTIEDFFRFETKALTEQLLSGLVFGLIASANILWLLYGKLLEQPRHVFTQLIDRFNINLFDMIFLSICAGVGEEMLFRGAIQHWLGIWPTAVIFIAIHGYLDPRDWKICLYGLMMIVIVAGMGYQYERTGLVASMTTHTLIDIAIFASLKYFPNLGERIS